MAENCRGTLVSISLIDRNNPNLKFMTGYRHDDTPPTTDDFDPVVRRQQLSNLTYFNKRLIINWTNPISRIVLSGNIVYIGNLKLVG